MLMLPRKIHIVLSVPVFLFLYSYTAVIVFLILIMAVLRFRYGIRHLTGLYAKSVFPLMGKKIHIEGKQHIQQGERYILLANHSSLFDIIEIGRAHV